MTICPRSVRKKGRWMDWAGRFWGTPGWGTKWEWLQASSREEVRESFRRHGKENFEAGLWIKGGYWIWGPRGSCSIGIWFYWYGARREVVLKELSTHHPTAVTGATCLEHGLGCSFQFLNPVKAKGKEGCCCCNLSLHPSSLRTKVAEAS